MGTHIYEYRVILSCSPTRSVFRIKNKKKIFYVSPISAKVNMYTACLSPSGLQMAALLHDCVSSTLLVTEL